jgi:pyruvate dehydrogenase E1 component alpha subunit
MGIGLDGIRRDDPEQDEAVLVYFGDGATSQGDTNEALIWAASYQTPQVFFLQNNHWAISVPVSRQSRTPLVRRAAGFGLRATRVDGNDVLASYAVSAKQLDDARAGRGPGFIEAMTYRLGAHTTSDDPTRYREADEVESWKAKDPIDRVRAYLDSAGTPPQFFTDLEGEGELLGEHLRERCGMMASPDLAELFDHVYVEQTDELREQQAAFVAWRGQYEGSPA